MYVSVVSAGDIIVILGIALIIAISSIAICVAPKIPTENPAVNPISLIGNFMYPIFTLTWSSALVVANDAYVDAKGLYPSFARPPAIPIRFCSAIPTL